jgi:hypothetical protein
MSKRKQRTARHRPILLGFDPAFITIPKRKVRVVGDAIPYSIDVVIDETSHLQAKDFVVPAFPPGTIVLLTASNDPSKNGPWVVRPEGLRRPAMTERDAPWLPVWARNDRTFSVP